MEPCLILSARRYAFDTDDGQHREGITLTYLTEDCQDEGNARGSFPMSVSAPVDLWDQLQQLPGFYDVDFRQRPGPKGKPTLTACNVRYRQSLSLIPPVD